ncbi:hypothetical protein SPWS13_3550 [Shewanella putrefaciens]|nr:hypothetical protein SPWS13_3550 [Shewanella putrefaciens]
MIGGVAQLVSFPSLRIIFQHILTIFQGDKLFLVRHKVLIL